MIYSVGTKSKAGFYVKTKAFLCLLVYVMVAITEYFIISNVSSAMASMRLIAIIVLFNLVFQLVAAKVNGISLYSFFAVFIVFYNLLHFGQVIMLGLFPSYEYNYLNYITVYMKDEALLKRTIILCLNVINCFFIGGLLYHFKPSKQLVKDENRLCRYEKNEAAKIVFFLLFPFRLFFDFTYLLAAFSGGYRATMGSSLPGVFGAFALMWYVAAPIYYIEISGKKTKKWFVAIFSAYVVITMLTGRRGHVVIALASLAVVVLSEMKKISFGKIVKYSLIGVIGLAFLDIVYEMRAGSIQSFLANQSSVVSSVIANNIILETIGTFGETMYTPYLVVRGYGMQFSPFFGECFVKSIASIFPDIFGWFKQINNEAIFSKMLGTGNAIGGSFAGEMYYNFGQWYPLFSTLLGYIIGRASHKVHIYIKNRNSVNIVSSLAFCSLSLWWIRDNIGNMLRQYVWIVFLYYVINYYITYRRNEV